MNSIPTPVNLSLGDGPAITVELVFEQGKFHSASLLFSPSFQCTIRGEADSALKEGLIAFLKGYGRSESVALDLSLEGLTPFRQTVLQTLQRVPFGETISYGELAEAAGHPKLFPLPALRILCRTPPLPPMNE